MKKIFLPQIILSLLLIWALYPKNSYSYYILLRWVACPIFIYLFYLYKEKSQIIIFFIIFIILYNPIKRIHLDREVWSVVNIVSIIFLITSIFLKNKKQ